MRLGSPYRFVFLALFALSVVPAAAAPVYDDEDEEPQYAPGLIATLAAGGEGVVRRVDDDVQFVWRDGAPDGRLNGGPFTGRWEGRLFTQTPGEYRFHVFAGGGRVELKLNGASLLAVEAIEPAWHVSPPVKLGYAHSPLELSFAAPSDEAARKQAVLKLHWSGPQFAVEPVPDRHLFHDPKATPDHQFDDGRSLVRMLRCAACHEIPTERERLPAPALTHLEGNLSPEWLVGHLASNQQSATSEPQSLARRMPHFAVTREDAEAIAAYLLDKSKSSASVKMPKAKADEPQAAAPPAAPLDPRAAEEAKRKKPKARKEPSVREGAILAKSIGCLACHTIDKLGTQSLFSGGDLTAIAAKRPAAFFVRWLTDPAKLNADHRMPVFKLSELERSDLVVYLATLRGEKNSDNDAGAAASSAQRALSPRGEIEEELVARGRRLIAEHRCASCHRLPTEDKALARLDDSPAAFLRKNAKSNWDDSCLGEPNAAKHRPGYRLDDTRRKAVATYLKQAAAPPAGVTPTFDGRFVLQERNCTACHARGLGQGLADDAPQITAAEPTLLPVQAALLPPSLNGVGDKLSEKALEEAVLLKREPLRPWLRVRMPKFPLAGEELLALQTHLVDHDRIPDLPPAPETASADENETAQRLAARRLVTADGFGCTSCHKIGNSEPAGITNIAAHGTDLTLLGERIRKPWFDRWVKNPSRIVPRMEMPAIQMPVKGVMHDDVNLQLASVWKVLNEPGFTPPLPNPVRIVRARNVPGLKERASVITDNFTIDDKTYDSAIVIGLPNRHNILFDLEQNRLAAWWTGDTGLERTKGKSWYWEPGGALVLGAPMPNEGSNDPTGAALHSEVTLLAGSSQTQVAFNPTSTTQVRSLLDEVRHIENGIQLRYRVPFVKNLPPSKRDLSELVVVQTIHSIEGGFRRRWELSGTRRAVNLLMTLATGNVFTEAGDRSVVAVELPGRPRLMLRSPGAFQINSLGVCVALDREADRFVCEVDYLVDLPVDTFPTDIPAMPNPQAVKIDVVPGYDGVQLPLSIAEMPTGMAWRKDGSLVFTSLKGRVIAARDTDGDGLEDTQLPVSDDLAAPYGIAVAEEDGKEVLDVINKYALLRLFDADGDGFYERNVVAADGWGHTDDYHDWAVGLPRIRGSALGKAAMGYYVGLPCQQDDRPTVKATYRGQGLKLLARTPTDEDPRRFSVEAFCGGLRFPMGLAVNKAGDLFASDNQGNYNPFNEVNHLQPGKRFGFINKLEAQPEFSPPFESPALELPHPWTRSVNGMCFLDTPQQVRAQRKADGQPANLFGPFEGHLLGCEFNYRSLFRMTLEKIDGVYQGAAFPFNEFPKENQPTFEGPTVCEVAPDGDLYVGNLQDSGWGGGRNTGSFVRLRPQDDATALPAGLADIRAETDGFTLEFTQPIDGKAAKERSAYTVDMFRRISTPQYGGNDVDRQNVKVTKVAVADDGRSVRLSVDKMRAGFVYEFHLANLAGGKMFFPAEGFYTMKRVPKP